MFHRHLPGGIELRQLAAEDAAPLFELVERHRTYLREWLPWVDHSRAPADVAEFIRLCTAQAEAGQGPTLAIVVDGAPSGCVGCHPIDWANRTCSLGYWLAADVQGRGIVSRSVAALVDYLIVDQGLHRIEIRCGTGNDKSCAIPRRLGFTLEGVLREAQFVGGRWLDLNVWSMLEKQWRR